MALLLDKASERRKQNLIVVEGHREISIALSEKFDCQTLYYCSEILNHNSKDLVELLQIVEKQPSKLQNIFLKNWLLEIAPMVC